MTLRDIIQPWPEEAMKNFFDNAQAETAFRDFIEGKGREEEQKGGIVAVETRSWLLTDEEMGDAAGFLSGYEKEIAANIALSQLRKVMAKMEGCWASKHIEDWQELRREAGMEVGDDKTRSGQEV